MPDGSSGREQAGRLGQRHPVAELPVLAHHLRQQPGRAPEAPDHLAEIGPVETHPAQAREAGHCARDQACQHHRRDAAGHAGRHQRPGAGPDVDVEVVDRAVGEDVVQGAQGADLVADPGHPAAGQDEGGLASFRALRHQGDCALPGRSRGLRRIGGCLRPVSDPQLLHHRAHRPRQVDPRRPPAGADRDGRAAGHAGPAPGPARPRAGAGDHHQAGAGPAQLQGQGRPRLRAQPDRYPGARRLRLRGEPLAGGVRGRGPGG